MDWFFSSPSLLTPPSALSSQSQTHFNLQNQETNFTLFFSHNKGVLASSHKKYVAVKKLDNMVREVEREFKIEVIVIGQKLANLKNNKKG